MSSLLWILVSTVLLSHLSEAYKALVIFPVPSKSHSILGDSLVELIAQAGYEVTYLTSFPREKPPARVKEIIVDGDRTIWTDGLNLTAVLNRDYGSLSAVNFLAHISALSLATLQNKEVQNIMNDPNEKFDVIIAEWLFNDIYAGLAAVFDCPMIWFSTVEHNWCIIRIIDDLPSPTYKPDIISTNQPPFTFIQRVQELGFQVIGHLLHYFHTSVYEHTQYDNIIAPSIRKRGKRVPNFEDLRFNASLVFGNSHVSIGDASSLPQIYKPIAGYHIPKDTAPLTGDLKELLDNAKHGVIYFCLGSNLKSQTLPEKLKSSLLKMFAGLKQTVLWKIEGDIPNRPSNVHVIQWAPQKSILAHQNCILFITHGGILSITEAIHFGKPLIGIPVYADQFSNVARAVKKGFAENVALSHKMADDMQVAIQKIIHDPNYTTRAKEISFIYFHRPVSPAAELLHWVNHVIQTRGALHLRSPALSVSWYQKIYLDLVLVILGIVVVLKILFKRILSMLCKTKQNMKKKKN